MMGRRKILGVVRFLLCAAIVALVLFPVFWMFISSMKSEAELVAAVPTLLPAGKWHFVENYGYVLTVAPFLTYLRNTVIVTICQMSLEIVIGIFAAYGFSWGRFRGKNALFLVTLGAMMIPIQVTFIPLYILNARVLNWKDTYAGIIMAGCVSAYTIFLLRQAFLGVDNSYLEAARIDGMNKVSVIFRILVPMCKATVITVILMSFINGWNNYFWPKIIANRYDETRVRTVAHSALKQAFNEDEVRNYNQIMAGATMAVLPVFAVFIIFQKHMLSGYSKAAMK